MSLNILNNNKIFYPLVLVLLIAVAMCGAHYVNRDNIVLDFVYVGQGDAAMLKLPRNKHILIDSGNWSGSGESFIRTYTKKLGINKIDAVFLSHYHDDHGAAIVQLLEQVEVLRLVLPALPRDTSNSLHDKIIATNTTAEVYYINSPVVVKTENDVSFTVVHFDADATDENARTVVMRLDAEKSVLFTGDIGFETEEAIVDSGVNIDCDVLKVAHHGSKYSSSEEFLSAVSPQIAVIGVGSNSFGHPSEQALQRLRDCGADIVRTDIDGTHTIKLN